MIQIGSIAEEKLILILKKLHGKKAQVITESRSFVIEIDGVQFRYPGISGVEIITADWIMNEKMQLSFHNSDGNLNNFESEFIHSFFQTLKKVLTTSDEVEFTSDSVKKIEIPIPAYASE